MFKFISNMQISHRLLCAFLLSAIVPGISISILGFTFISTQQTRSQAVQTNIRLFKSATTTSAYLPQMINLLKLAYHDQYDVLVKPLTPQEQALDTLSQLAVVTYHFDQTLAQYQKAYRINTSPQMSIIRSILFSDNPNSPLSRQQQVALDQIVHQLWPDYQHAQNELVNALNTKASSDQAVLLLQRAITKHTELATGWD